MSQVVLAARSCIVLRSYTLITPQKMHWLCCYQAASIGGLTGPLSEYGQAVTVYRKVC